MQYIIDRINLSLFRLKYYFKSWIQEPQLFLLYVFGRFESIRKIKLLLNYYLHRREQNTDRNKSSDSVSFKNYNEIKDTVVQTLKKDGLYCGFNLPYNLIQEIQAFSSQTIFFGNGNPQYVFTLQDKAEKEKKWNSSFIIGECSKPGAKCQAIKTIETNSTILDIASNYLGCQAIHIGSRLFWSFAIDTTEAERMPFAQVFFHYDMYDYSAVSFFFYLSNVDACSGPHICVKGSHQNKKIFHKLSLFLRKLDKEIITSYGANNIISIQGDAGFGFIEDPYCFHKAAPPINRDRLVLIITFGLGTFPKYQFR